MEIRHFRAEDIAPITERPSEQVLRPYVSREMALAMQASPWGITGASKGRAVFAAGIVPYWEGRGEAWSIWSHDITLAETLAAVREIKKQLAACSLRRVESIVRRGNEEAHKLDHMLGFVLEAPYMKGYFPDGSDAALYARCK